MCPRLFYSDGLHLIEKGDLKLAKSIQKAIDIYIPIQSIANLKKNLALFKLNECDFPPLQFPATRYKVICSQVKCVSVFINPFVLCLNHLFKITNLFYLSYLFDLYRSQCLTVHCINLLLPLCLFALC